MPIDNLENLIKCPHSPVCNGCNYWDIDYKTELQHKKEELKNKLNSSIEIRVKTTNIIPQRVRFDFTYKNNILGLYSKDKELTEIKTCLILDPKLQKSYEILQSIFSTHKVPFTVASLRLRLSPIENQKPGLWLDLANKEVKDLLVEKKFLNILSEKFIIEIGQKRKRLKLDPKGDQHKLEDPKPEIWFKTLDQNLYSFVGSFTQPCWQSADLLTTTMIEMLERLSSKPLRITEYGSGIGQYTIPLLGRGHQMNVFESDQLALECLALNKGSKDIELNTRTKADAALVNPPRSGLREFADKLVESKVDSIIYISCSVDSLAVDKEKLESHYQMKEIYLVDQFPRTKHFESVVLFQRIK